MVAQAPSAVHDEAFASGQLTATIEWEEVYVDDLDADWIDILTGHASARFKGIDVRSAEERRANGRTPTSQ